MNQDLQSLLQKFRSELREIGHYEEATRLMEWDLRTGAPKKGHELRAEALGTLSAKIFAMLTSENMGRYLNELTSAEAELSQVDRALLRVVRETYERSKKIPPERHQAYVMLVAKSQSVWEEAKKQANFSLLKPYLEKIIAFKREFIQYWGIQNHPYDTLLNLYEPGLTVAKIDPIFKQLREATVDLVQRIGEKGFPKFPVSLRREAPIHQQRHFSEKLLERIGYDFQAGRLDETAHPFEESLNHYDVRVTTKFVLDDVLNAMYSTLHEGGHALYEQHVSAELIGTPLCHGASMGIHESQSRFWENMLGRSRSFLQAIYGDFQAAFPGLFADVHLETLYQAANHVEPSLIRIEADELTYNLHIMIRYEIERALFEETCEVGDLPRLWNEKVRDYLGLETPNDALGVLQDVHWSGGDFGYFPTYSLGNLYAAQFRETLYKEIPDIEKQWSEGDFSQVLEWFSTRVHSHGKVLLPSELIEQATGKPLSADYLIRYLQQKMSDIYQV
ncbi:carboxypeptidase M32 [Alicyclobacillus tolerans]|uniref:carboxypeptidase M32 n=1 Tax=Alicyclobacillus tolerans TaxID=90970 RepID=UPI003B77B5DA